MKNLKRALRRHKKNTKFIKRIKKYFCSSLNRKENIADATSGKHFTFLRTTGNPCNCFMCSGYYKYKRIPKHKAIKDAFE